MPATFLDSGLHRPALRVRAAWSPLLAASLFCAVLFLLLCVQVGGSRGALPFDEAAAALLSPYRSPGLLASFALLTVLGSGNGVVLAGALASACLALQRRWRLAAVFWGVLACSGVSAWAVKVLVARPRPEFIEGFAASSPSFPSSHAVAALAGYGFLAYVLARDARPATRWLAAVAATLLVVLVAGSRVMLGLHHASDVIGGLLLAGCWFLAGVLAARRMSSR
ncbi:MAG TPA: phosphatase PAP2 family protein [Ramlibacter sp.]|uniref:phosphatase PAP2 family protein n=1 Tax=Ramlibacter sp. TaxID=1917967 RepID=UPI002ED23270